MPAILNMIRDGKPVARVFVDGERAVLAWPTSVIVYPDIADLFRVHVDHMGGRGASTKFALVSECAGFLRGIQEAYQDRCEGVPMSQCIDDLQVVVPAYIPTDQEAGWLEGYSWFCMDDHGWRRDGRFAFSPEKEGD